MKKTLVSMVAALGLFSGSALADFLGLYVGTGMWNHAPSGNFNSTNSSSIIDLDSSLAMSSDNEAYLYAAFEHPIPLVPNIRMESTALTHDGTASGVTFNGVGGLTGASTISLDSIDTVLYWRILDNWVNVDLGLAMRKYDGDFTVGTQTRTISESVPLAYAAVQFDLPFTGLSVGGDYNYVSLSGNRINDIRIRLLYEMGIIGFEGGIRNYSVKLDDADGVNVDMSFDGVFLGVFLHF